MLESQAIIPFASGRCGKCDKKKKDHGIKLPVTQKDKMPHTKGPLCTKTMPSI
jgi:hypothetical protein